MIEVQQESDTTAVYFRERTDFVRKQRAHVMEQRLNAMKNANVNISHEMRTPLLAVEQLA